MSAEIARVEFSSDQVSLIKRTICQGASDDELSLFLAQCKRTGLDPFARQIHAVKRFDKKAGREIMSIQIGIDGFRLIGERTGQSDGQEGPFWCGEDGEWHDVWISEKFPVAAKVLVYRKDRTRPYTGIAHWSEYAQTYKDGNPLPMWAQMPAGQLAKCAESLALRKAFPQELSGLYSPDEMSQVATTEPEPERTPTRPANVKQLPATAPAPDLTREIEAARDLLKSQPTLSDMGKTWATLPPHIQRALASEKDAIKDAMAEVAEAQAQTGEGENSSDPTPTTTSPSDPPPLVMPAADRRTTAPDGAPPLPADAKVQRSIMDHLHELELSWTDFRDQVGKGKQIADAANVRCGVLTRIGDLTAVEAGRLNTELGVRVAEKRQRAAQRNARKDAKAGATS